MEKMNGGTLESYINKKRTENSRLNSRSQVAAEVKDNSNLREEELDDASP